MYQSFEDLEVWKRGCQLAVRVNEILGECRDYGIRDQMQRASVSVPSNIAEGYERRGKEFLRFLTIARGSSAELRTQAYIGAKIGVLSLEQMNELVMELKEITKMLVGLAISIKRDLEE